MEIKKHIMGPHTFMRGIHESEEGARPKKILVEVFTAGPVSGMVLISEGLDQIRLEPGEARELQKFLNEYLPDQEEA